MSTTKLQFQFSTSDGSKFNQSYNYVNPSVSTPAVRALASGIVANGSIFKKVPLSALSAKLVTTTETVIDLS